MQEFVGLFMFVLLALLFAFGIMLLGVAGNLFGRLLNKFLQAGDKFATQQTEDNNTKSDEQNDAEFSLSYKKKENPVKLNIKFFLSIVLFALLVTQIILTIPISVICGEQSSCKLICVMIFVSVFLFSVFYAQRKNSLKWKE